jgi:hypothetical protein
MTRKDIFRLLLLGAAGLSLAGCGGGGGGGSAATAPPLVIPFEAQFGTGFNTDFAASPNSQPATPSASDIVAVSLTTQPVALPSS